MKTRKGFTLIELLVVISIIALLMSILMPALGKVRAMAKSIACRSNEKQWHIAYMSYASENDGFFIPGNPQGSRPDWNHIYKLQKYYKNMKMMLCPMAIKPYEGDKLSPVKAYGPLWELEQTYGPPVIDTSGDCGKLVALDGTSGLTWGAAMAVTGHPNWWKTYEEIPEGEKYISFMANDWVRDDQCAMYKTRPFIRSTSNIKDPGITPLMLDGKQNIVVKPDHIGGPSNTAVQLLPPFYEGEPAGVGINPDPTPADALKNGLKMLCINRHDYTNNVVFIDGAARPAGLKELWKLRWHQTFDTTDTTKNPYVAAPGYTPPWADEAPWMVTLKDY